MAPEATTADLNLLQRLEEELWLEDTRFDRSYMEQVFADEFFEFGRSGKIYSREDILSQSRATIAAVIPLENFQVQMITGDVALVTYNSTVTFKDTIQKGRRSSLWRRKGQSWSLQFHQGTPYT